VQSVTSRYQIIANLRVVRRDVIAQLSYGLDDRGSRFRFPEGAGNFPIQYRVQNGSGAHPASYPVGTTREFFPGGKGAGA
jgi:hypothetical protein